MMKLLSVVEDIRQTQKVHSAMLQSLQKQLLVKTPVNEGKLPDGIKLPCQSMQDIDLLDSALSVEAVRRTIVSFIKLIF
jgi:hypothetical protein